MSNLLPLQELQARHGHSSDHSKLASQANDKELKNYAKSENAGLGVNAVVPKRN